ncbi:MAG: polymerase, sigma-24 subunit, subfamily protein [Candidatus Peribacteria bacterium]|nr:polymerase, sigma-24 subunit, subfamily protein [Candidatus Peribacteria bacterium]
MATTDEQSLIASCQAGNLEDFDPLYRTYIQQIYGFIYRRTLVRQTAEDLTSITFMKALQKIDSYSGDKGVFAAWLYRIARNTITDYYRTNHEHTDIETVWDLSEDNRMSETLDDKQAYLLVRGALQKLEPEKRDIVMLRMWDGLSYKEIAVITGKTETNCKVIFSRSLDWLRKEIPLAAFLLLLFSPIRL